MGFHPWTNITKHLLKYLQSNGVLIIFPCCGLNILPLHGQITLRHHSCSQLLRGRVWTSTLLRDEPEIILYHKWDGMGLGLWYIKTNIDVYCSKESCSTTSDGSRRQILNTSRPDSAHGGLLHPAHAPKIAACSERCFASKSEAAFQNKLIPNGFCFTT